MTLKQTLRFCALLVLLTGLVYTPTVTMVAQRLVPFQANGSIVATASGSGASLLVAQSATGDQYFWHRPTPYKDWEATIRTRINTISKTAQAAEVPADMVMAASDGSDPYISIENAQIQLFRVATARGVSAEVVSAIVDRLTIPATARLIGVTVVNVNQLNIVLDQVLPNGAPTPILPAAYK